MDLVYRGVAGREHDDRHPAARLPEPLQYSHPVQPRQHDVEDDDLGLEPPGLLQAGGTVVGATDAEAQTLELRFDEADDRAVVHNEQHARSRSHVLLTDPRAGILIPGFSPALDRRHGRY